MSVKKNKLPLSLSFNFDLLGIVAAAPPHTMAWWCNKCWGVHLTRQPDLQLAFVKGHDLALDYFLFEAEHAIFRLLKNKAIENDSGKPNWLLPECKQYDFIVKASGTESFFAVPQAIQLLRQAPVVTYVAAIEVQTLKSKDNLIF